MISDERGQSPDQYLSAREKARKLFQRVMRQFGQGYEEKIPISRPSSAPSLKEVHPPHEATPESELIQPIKGRIISETELKDFREKNGFNDGWHGTWRSKDKQAYLYLKPQYIFKDSLDAENASKIARYLTSKGILYPHAEWGTMKNDKGEYHLFPIVRKLQILDPSNQTIPAGWQKLYTPKILRETEGLKLEPNQWAMKTMWEERYHITSWYRRIDPSFDPTREPQNELVNLLNPFEASHYDNWGWDPQTGILYPIDIEVVSLNQPEEIAITKRWVEAEEATHS